jgi:tyrosine aminotransferase
VLGDPTIFGNLMTPNEVLSAVEDQVWNPRAHGYAPSVGFEQARTAVANYHTTVDAPLSSKVLFIWVCDMA